VWKSTRKGVIVWVIPALATLAIRVDMVRETLALAAVQAEAAASATVAVGASSSGQSLMRGVDFKLSPSFL